MAAQNVQSSKRQGDILIVPLDAVPDGEGVEEKPVGGRLLIAAGESTGHHHALVVEGDGTLPTIKWFGDRRVIIAETPFVEVHEEHGPIHYGAGAYEIVRQFESHAQLPRMVID